MYHENENATNAANSSNASNASTSSTNGQAPANSQPAAGQTGAAPYGG